MVEWGKLGKFAKCHLDEEELKRSQTITFEGERNVKQTFHDEEKTGGCMTLVERQDWLSHIYSDGGRARWCVQIFVHLLFSEFALKFLKG